MADFSLSGGVRILGFISPFDTNDTYAVIDPLYGVDGLRNVKNITELNAITTERRRAGMVVGVDNTTGTTYYTLKNSPWTDTITDWFETHTVSDNLITFPSTIDAQTYLSGGTNLIDIIKNDGDIVDGQNVGSGSGIFKDKSGTTLNFRTLTGVAPSNKITTAVSGDTVQLDIDESEMTLWPLVVTGNKLISGNVTFVSGLTFDVSALEYIIGSNVYNATASQVTLSSGDTSFDRIDVIYADVSGNTGVVEGTPTANPSKPNVNTATQVEVTFVTVPAGSSTPDVSITKIYDENLGSGGGEWDYSATTSVRLSGDSTADAFSGTKSVEFISANTSDSFTMTIPTSYDLSDDNILTFYIKNKVAWNGDSIDISLLDSGDTINGSVVTLQDSVFGFDDSNTSGWQVISIDLASFNLSNNLVSKVRFEVTSPTDPLNLFIDLIRFQSGAATVSPQNIWYSIVGDDNNTTEATSPTDQLRFSGGTNIETSVDNKRVTFDITSGISATYIGDGTVTNTEYQYLSGVTSNIQTQFDGLIDNNDYVSGGTYNDTTKLLSFSGTNTATTFNVSLSALSTEDTFVTGGTLSTANTLTLNYNITGNTFTPVNLNNLVFSGGSGSCISDLYVSNLHGCSPITILNPVQLISPILNPLTANTLSDNFIGSAPSFIIGSGNTDTGDGNYTGNLIVGRDNSSNGSEGNVIFGVDHIVTGVTPSNGYNLVLGGENIVEDSYLSFTQGFQNTNRSYAGTVFGALSTNETNYSFVQGYNNTMGANGFSNAIIGGYNHNIIGSPSAFGGSLYSVIIGGVNNTIPNNVDSSVILGGQNITATTSNTVYVPRLNINTNPTSNLTATDILVRNSSTGNIERRSLSSITALTSEDVYVTGGTHDGTETITLTNNSGGTFNITGVAYYNTLTAHTTDTNNPHQTSLGNLFGGSAHTHTISDVIGLQTQLNNKFDKSGGTVTGSVVITGNVDILGTATTINTETLTVEDNIITLNSNVTGNTEPILDSGIEVLRGSATTSQFLWDETNDYWVAGLSGSTSRVILEGDSLSLLSSAHTHTLSDITDFNTYSGSVNNQITAHTSDGTIHFTKNSINLSDLGSSAHTHTLSDITDFNTYSSSTYNTITAHTSDTSIHHTLASLDTRYVNITGDTMTGTLILPSGSTTEPSLILSSGGTLLTSTQVGAFEFVGSTLFFTDETNTRRNVLLGASGATATTLDALTDTLVTNPDEGDIMYFDATTGFWRKTGILSIDDTGSTVTINNNLGTNGTITLLNNAFFLDGRSASNSNVSLIGVTTDDIVRIGNQGHINHIMDETYVKGALSADTLYLVSAATLNNSATEILVRNSTTGEVQYRPLSGITPDTNTFVTGYTYEPTGNTFTIGLNNGSAYTATISTVSGLTTTGTIDAGTLEGDTITSGGTNLDQIFTQDAFTTFSSTTAGQTLVVADSVNDQINFSGVNINILTNDTTKTITFSADTEVGEVNTASNVGGGVGIFSGKTGVDLRFRTLESSGGTVDFVTTTGGTINLEVTHTVDTNDYVTGGTFNSDGELTLVRNNNTSADTIDFTTTKRLVITSDQSLAISAGRSYLVDTGASLLSFNNDLGTENEEASFNFSVPSDYVTGGTFYIRMTTLASTPPNNETQFVMNITSVDLGGDLSTSTDTGISGVTSASTTSWEIVESPSYSPVTATFSVNKTVSVKINRNVQDVPDTYTGNVYVWGLVFEYTGIR